MKKTFTGWIGKKQNPEIILYSDEFQGLIKLDDVYTTKGKKRSWVEGDWPPIKVKVPVETVENEKIHTSIK